MFLLSGQTPKSRYLSLLGVPQNTKMNVVREFRVGKILHTCLKSLKAYWKVSEYLLIYSQYFCHICVSVKGGPIVRTNFLTMWTPLDMLQFNSNTNYPELVHTGQVKGTVPEDCPTLQMPVTRPRSSPAPLKIESPHNPLLNFDNFL